jgi:hypothetical protein
MYKAVFYYVTFFTVMFAMFGCTNEIVRFRFVEQVVYV